MNSRCVLLPLSVLLLSGCASLTGYLGRRPFAHGPYYHTWSRHSVPDSAVIAHLPIQFDIIAAELPPDGARMLEPLLSAMNGYLDGAGWSTRLDSAPSPPDEAPWAYVGTSTSLAGVEAARHFFSVDVAMETGAEMVIQAKQPSRRWRAQLAAIAAAQHADYVLVISLGAAEYYPRSRRFPSLRMAVDLGTGNTVPVSWLTNSDVPVPVIHLMGLLLSRDGRVLRAGAEGLVVKEPNFLLSAFLHAQNPLTEGDVASLLASRHREDIEGQPLAWEVALRNLVRQLLGKP